MNINQKLFDHGFGGVFPLHVRLGVVLLVGLGFCLLSLGAGFVLGFFDKRAERITKRKSGDGVWCLPLSALCLCESLPPHR